jgi:hypothetical protein
MSQSDAAIWIPLYVPTKKVCIETDVAHRNRTTGWWISKLASCISERHGTVCLVRQKS